MSEFDEWMGKKCSVIQSAYGEEYIAAQEAWDFQQAKIDNLKAQLNNMEACYIEKKKQVDLTLNIITDIKKAGIEMEKTPNVRKVGMVLINFMSGLEIALRGAND